MAHLPGKNANAHRKLQVSLGNYADQASRHTWIHCIAAG